MNKKTAKHILFIFGTRPEAIKMAPVIKQMKEDKNFKVSICVTAQHRDMLDQVLKFFDIKPNFDLNIMKQDQSLYNITSEILTGIESVIKKANPDIILVQGDTTTAFVASLAAFYQHIPVGHIEAGLRSGDKFAPYPEEVNRKLISHIADIHFAPTQQAVVNLSKEGITKNVFMTTNTAIDALLLGLNILKHNSVPQPSNGFKSVNFEKPIILVTAHRRENFGEPFQHIFNAIKIIAQIHDVEIVYPVHPNPNVSKLAHEQLASQPNIHLTPPLDYPDLIWIMNKSYLILTDSGGIQEEAPALGKPVLVLRDVTERQEGIESGTAILVGSDETKIKYMVHKLLNDPEVYGKMARARNPYGIGKATQQILQIIKQSSL